MPITAMPCGPGVTGSPLEPSVGSRISTIADNHRQTGRTSEPK